MAPSSAVAIEEALLAWFDAHRRDLPWRRTKDPYRILVAEFVLQRTRVASGTPYYERFLRRFPDVASLARAPLADVLREWEGLGFYRRARNLHAAAKAIVERHAGQIPSRAADLRELPGVGPYTAGAVASIAFGERVPAVDGNAVRVIARLHRIEQDVSHGPGRARVHALAKDLVPVSRPGAFNQALMELGATVCVPRAPACDRCPLADLCLARAAGIQASLPWAAAPRPVREVPVAFAYVESKGRVLLVHRPEGGLLGGLWSLPGGELDSDDVRASLRGLVHAQTGGRTRIGGPVLSVDHTFSHRIWRGAIYACRFLPGRLARGARWMTPEDARSEPLVPFVRKAIAALAARTTLESFDRRRR